MRFKAPFLCLSFLALATIVSAQTKISGTAQCKADPSTPIPVGDRPGHALAAGKSQCTWSKLEIDGQPAKTGVSVYTNEIDGDKSSGQGYHTGTMANGDTWTCRFQGTSTSKDGKPVADGGTYTFASGTGKLKGIQGKGTYKGTPNADGSMTYAVDGEYRLPK
jgi:hypothetical protein